jgi:hypothetical protein
LPPVFCVCHSKRTGGKTAGATQRTLVHQR